MRHRPLYFVALAFALILGLAASGCSSDDNGGSDAATKKSDRSTTTTAPGSSTSTSTSIKPPKGATGGDLQAFCTAFHEIEKLGFGDFNSLPPAQQPAAIRAHYTKVGAAGKRMLAAAPTEIKHAVEVAVKINDEVVASGTLKPFDSTENKENGPLLGAYGTQQCKS